MEKLEYSDKKPPRAGWRDATHYPRGARGVIEPREWSKNFDWLEVTVHHMHELPDDVWFISTRPEVCDDQQLDASDIEAALLEAENLIEEKARSLLAAFVDEA